MTVARIVILCTLLLVGSLVLVPAHGFGMLLLLVGGLFGPFAAGWLGKKVAEWLSRRRR